MFIILVNFPNQTRNECRCGSSGFFVPLISFHNAKLFSISMLALLSVLALIESERLWKICARERPFLWRWWFKSSIALCETKIMNFFFHLFFILLLNFSNGILNSVGECVCWQYSFFECTSTPDHIAIEHRRRRCFFFCFFLV